MEVVVKKRDNSAPVRIPSGVMKAARLELDQRVDVREEGGCIVIRPVRPTTYLLDDLLAGITPENRHEEIDVGVPVGKEAL